MVPPARVALWLIAVAVMATGCATPTLDRIDPARPEAAAAAPLPVAPSAPAPEPEPSAPAEPRPGPAPTALPSPEPEPEPVLRPPKDGDGPVRVALLLPLSGGNAGIGRDLLDAAQLALFDAAPARFELAPRDTGGTPEGAREAAESALQGGAHIILGPLFGTSVRAAAGAARARGVPIVAFSTDRAVAGNGVYLLGIMPDQQVDRAIAFAARRGLGRFAALVPADAYGDTVLEALERASGRHGGAVVRIVRYAPQAGEWREPVLRLAAFGGPGGGGAPPFDAVFIPQGGAALRRIAPLLAYHDVDPGEVRFIGTSLWEEPGLGREPSLVGGWFAAPSPAESAAFLARFAETYGRRPPRIATLAYDAVALATALAGAPGGADFSPAALADPSGFAGVDGVFRFRPDGIAERGLAVVEVEADGLRVIGPAPRTFERLTN